MRSRRAARPQGHRVVNPKFEPAPNATIEKEPDDWVSGQDPMTAALASHLKTLSEERGEPDSFPAGLHDG